MQKFFAASLFAVLFSVVAIQALPVEAQTSAAQPDQFLESLRTSILTIVGAPNNAVNISIEDGVLTVISVNSGAGDVNKDSRNNQATRIASTVSKAISTNPEYKNIHTISVLYQGRDGSAAEVKTIDTIKFRKDQAGVFVIHTT